MAVAIGLRSTMSRRSHELAAEWQALVLPGSEMGAMRVVKDSFLDAERMRTSEMRKGRVLMPLKSKSTGALRRGKGSTAELFEASLGIVDSVARQRKCFSSTRGFDVVCKGDTNKQSDVECALENGDGAPTAVHKPRTAPAASHTVVAIAPVETGTSALNAHAEELLADAMASRQGGSQIVDHDKLMQRGTQKRVGKNSRRQARLIPNKTEHADNESALRGGATQEGPCTKSASYIENYRDLLCKGELQDFKYVSDHIGRKQIAKLDRSQASQILGESTDEERIPASQLDCLDLSRSPKGQNGRLLRSSTCEDVPRMETSSTMTSGAPHDEALGDLFATRLQESQVAAQKHKSSRKSKKSKKNKENSASVPNTLRAQPGHFMDMTGHGEAKEDAEAETIHDGPTSLPNKSPLRQTQSAAGLRCPEKPQQPPAGLADARSEDDVSRRSLAVEASASTSRQTIDRIADSNLWSIELDDNANSCSDPYSVWDCGTEVYNAWGGDDEWGEIDASWSTEVPVIWQ